MTWIKDSYEPGKGLSSVPAQALTMLANFCNTLEFQGGRIERTADYKYCRIIPNRPNGDINKTYSFEVTATSTSPLIRVNGGYCQYASNAEVHKEYVEFDLSDEDDGTFSVYIKLNIMNGTFDDPTYAEVVPPETATESYYRIADVVIADGAISGIVQRHLGDIYESRA